MVGCRYHGSHNARNICDRKNAMTWADVLKYMILMLWATVCIAAIVGKK